MRVCERDAADRFSTSMIAGRAAASANVRRKAKAMRKEHAAMRAEEKIQVDPNPAVLRETLLEVRSMLNRR